MFLQGVILNDFGYSNVAFMGNKIHITSLNHYHDGNGLSMTSMMPHDLWIILIVFFLNVRLTISVQNVRRNTKM